LWGEVGQPDHDCGEHDLGTVVARALVVVGRDRPPVFGPCEGAFRDVVLSIQLMIEARIAALIYAGGDRGGDTALSREGAHRGVAISCRPPPGPEVAGRFSSNGSSRADSWRWPGLRQIDQGRPALSTARRTLAPTPPRDRPRSSRSAVFLPPLASFRGQDRRSCGLRPRVDGHAPHRHQQRWRPGPASPIARVNRERERRTDVVQIFPHTKSVICLVGVMLVEINEEMIAT
jgi:hypothetical protein